MVQPLRFLVRPEGQLRDEGSIDHFVNRVYLNLRKPETKQHHWLQKKRTLSGSEYAIISQC